VLLVASEQVPTIPSLTDIFQKSHYLIPAFSARLSHGTDLTATQLATTLLEVTAESTPPSSNNHNNILDFYKSLGFLKQLWGTRLVGFIMICLWDPVLKSITY
jgi:hypothetical protein